MLLIDPAASACWGRRYPAPVECQPVPWSPLSRLNDGPGRQTVIQEAAVLRSRLSSREAAERQGVQAASTAPTDWRLADKISGRPNRGRAQAWYRLLWMMSEPSPLRDSSWTARQEMALGCRRCLWAGGWETGRSLIVCREVLERQRRCCRRSATERGGGSLDFRLALLLLRLSPLWVRSTTGCQQPPEWSVLGQVDCVGPWQPMGVEVVLHCLHPGHLRSSWWSLLVHRRRGSQDLLCAYIVIYSGDMPE